MVYSPPFISFLIWLLREEVMMHSISLISFYNLFISSDSSKISVWYFNSFILSLKLENFLFIVRRDISSLRLCFLGKGEVSNKLSLSPCSSFYLRAISVMWPSVFYLYFSLLTFIWKSLFDLSFKKLGVKSSTFSEVNCL